MSACWVKNGSWRGNVSLKQEINEEGPTLLQYDVIFANYICNNPISK